MDTSAWFLGPILILVVAILGRLGRVEKKMNRLLDTLESANGNANTESGTTND